MAIVLTLLGTALELVLLAACVHGCLTLKRLVNTTCHVEDAVRSSVDEVTFEFMYNKPACEFLWDNIPACWRITPIEPAPPNDPCQYKWSPSDSCNPESKSGCYKRENDIFYLRHVVDKKLWEMMRLSRARFDVTVKREANAFHFRDMYFFEHHESLPRVFDVEDEKLTLNDETISIEVPDHTILLGVFYDLEYCVHNLMKGIVRVDLGGNVTKGRLSKPCVHVVFIARKAHNGSEVTLSFDEKGGCKRSGRTSKIGLLVDMSTGMMVTETIKEPSSSSLPHIQCWSVFIGFILVCSL